MATAPVPLTHSPTFQPGLLQRQVTLGHTPLGQRERDEDADRIERDEARTFAPKMIRSSAAAAREHHDAVCESQATAALANWRGMKWSSAGSAETGEVGE